MWLILIGIIVFCIFVFSSKSENTKIATPVKTAVVKPVVNPTIDNSIIKETISLLKTAINLSNTRSGAVLRVSIFEFRGEAMIEHCHSLFTRECIDPVDLQFFNTAISTNSAENDRLMASQRIAKALGSSYSDWDNIAEYFSLMQTRIESGSASLNYINASKKVKIPVHSVSIYFSAILKQIREQWPYLQIEVDSQDIDIHI